MEHHYPECVACDVTICLRRCCADALLSVIGRIFSFFMTSETPRIYSMFGCKFIPGVEKCCHSFSKDAIFTNIWLEKCWSDGVNLNTARICSLNFSYTLTYVFFNLVTPFYAKYKPSINTNLTQIWLIRNNKNMYDQC